MGLYTFTLEKFSIRNTRSRHEDTDTVSFSLQVGANSLPSRSFAAGDVNNGDHPVNLAFRSVFVADPDAAVLLSYIIYNGAVSALPRSLDAITQTVAQQGLEELTGLDQNPDQADLSDFTDPTADPSAANGDDGDILLDDGWLRALPFLELGAFIAPNCDGFVVAGSVGQKKSRWDQLIAGSPGTTCRRSVRYPGSDSPAGCGSNSDYSVTCSVTYERVVGPGPHSLRQFLRDHKINAKPGLRAASSSSRRISLRALMSLTATPAS